MAQPKRARVETLRFTGGALELLDQRRLPLEVRYQACTSAAEVAQAIRTMIVRGAPAIGCAAAYGVALEAQRLAGADEPAHAAAMDQAFRTLGESRPTAVNLFWALSRMKGVLAESRHGPKALLAERLLREAHAITSEDVANNQRLGEHGAALLPQRATVLTHCNAGALATAGHGTALGVIRSAVASGKRISVLADETRPFLQGARLTAWELHQEGIPVSLITDSMAGYYLSRGEVQAVIVGADRVALNGDVANKIGTYPLAVLADRHHVPFYVACPLSSIDAEMESGEQIPIEQRDADEVTQIGGQRIAPPGVSARHPAFDVTPAELVTALITERGSISRPNRSKLSGLFDFDPKTLV